MAENKSKMVVLIAVDPSKWAEEAFEWYFDNVHREENEVICVHSIEPPTLIGDPVSLGAEVYESGMQFCHAQSKAIQDKFGKKLVERHAVGRVICQISGRAGELVVSTAVSEKATMIVIGTRGVGTIRRTILGSVSDYVVHHAQCPVMVKCHHH